MKDFLSKYYQNNKERKQKNFVKHIRNLSKEEKKNDNIVVNNTKAYYKMENKSLLSIKKCFTK